MGIDRTPTDHLGTKAAALEAIGVPTAVGQLNAMAIWSDAERAIRRDAVKADRTYRTTQDDLNALAKDVTAVDAVHPALRSEEHTSELQSLMRISYAVFCLKKKIAEYTAQDNLHRNKLNTSMSIA